MAIKINLESIKSDPLFTFSNSLKQIINKILLIIINHNSIITRLTILKNYLNKLQKNLYKDLNVIIFNLQQT